MEAEAQPTNLEGLSEDDLPLDDDEARTRLAKIRRLERWRALGPWVVIPGASVLYAGLFSACLALLNVAFGASPFHIVVELWYLAIFQGISLGWITWNTLPAQIKALQKPEGDRRKDSDVQTYYGWGFLLVGLVFMFVAGTYPIFLWPTWMVLIASGVFFTWGGAIKAKDSWRKTTKPIGKVILICIYTAFALLFGGFLMVLAFSSAILIK